MLNWFRRVPYRRKQSTHFSFLEFVVPRIVFRFHVYPLFSEKEHNEQFNVCRNSPRPYGWPVWHEISSRWVEIRLYMTYSRGKWFIYVMHVYVKCHSWISSCGHSGSKITFIWISEILVRSSNQCHGWAAGLRGNAWWKEHQPLAWEAESYCIGSGWALTQ